MTREMMMDKVIRTRGFEDKWTIWFCTLCEDKGISDEALLSAMIVAEAMPFSTEDDDEEEEL